MQQRVTNTVVGISATDRPTDRPTHTPAHLIVCFRVLKCFPLIIDISIAKSVHTRALCEVRLPSRCRPDTCSSGSRLGWSCFDCGYLQPALSALSKCRENANSNKPLPSGAVSEVGSVERLLSSTNPLHACDFLHVLSYIFSLPGFSLTIRALCEFSQSIL